MVSVVPKPLKPAWSLSFLDFLLTDCQNMGYNWKFSASLCNSSRLPGPARSKNFRNIGHYRASLFL